MRTAIQYQERAGRIEQQIAKLERKIADCDRVLKSKNAGADEKAIARIKKPRYEAKLPELRRSLAMIDKFGTANPTTKQLRDATVIDVPKGDMRNAGNNPER